MPKIDLSQLADEAQEFLDLDPRFWDRDEGSFEWSGQRVYFRKLVDRLFVMTWDGRSLEFTRQ